MKLAIVRLGRVWVCLGLFWVWLVRVWVCLGAFRGQKSRNRASTCNLACETCQGASGACLGVCLGRVWVWLGRVWVLIGACLDVSGCLGVSGARGVSGSAPGPKKHESCLLMQSGT